MERRNSIITEKWQVALSQGIYDTSYHFAPCGNPVATPAVVGGLLV